MDAIPHGSSSGYGYHKCRCDECRAWKSAASAEHYARNRERRKAEARAYYEANRAEVRAKQNARSASLSASERDADRARNREYLERPGKRGEQYARAKKYSQSPAGRLVHKAAAHRRRGVPLAEDAKTYVEILLGDPCAYCGAPGGEIDHIEPVVAGGDGEWDNLTAACRSCNGRKWQKSLLEFLLGRRP